MVTRGKPQFGPGYGPRSRDPLRYGDDYEERVHASGSRGPHRIIAARQHQGRPPSKCAPPRRWTKARHIARQQFPACAAAALSTVHYPSEILPTITGFTYVSLLDAPAPPATWRQTRIASAGAVYPDP